MEDTFTDRRNEADRTFRKHNTNYRPQEIQSLENRNASIVLDFCFTASQKVPAYLILSSQLTLNNNFSTTYNFDLTADWRRYYALDLQFNQLNIPLGIGYALKFNSTNC